MDADEVLQILGSGVIEGPPGVHSLMIAVTFPNTRACIKAEETTPHVTGAGGAASSPTNVQAIDRDQRSTAAWPLCHSHFK